MVCEVVLIIEPVSAQVSFTGLIVIPVLGLALRLPRTSETTDDTCVSYARAHDL